MDADAVSIALIHAISTNAGQASTPRRETSIKDKRRTADWGQAYLQWALLAQSRAALLVVLFNQAYNRQIIKIHVRLKRQKAVLQ